MCCPFRTGYEQDKREEIEKLMEDWKAVIKTKAPMVFPDDKKKYPTIDYFNSDGFFPGYFSSDSKRILFIGRESRYCSGKDRILSDLEWFKNGSVNTSAYWRRILYITYGIQMQGKVEFDDVPYAKDILNEMIKRNKYGFAIMNISKYSNDEEYGRTANYEQINRFLIDTELSKRNFIREEIEILDPEIIITANLWNGKIDETELEKIFPTADCSNYDFYKDKKNIANMWDFDLNEKKVKLIDLYHFSCIGSDRNYFYDPVMSLLYP